MSITKLFNIEKLKNKDLFDIRSFVVVFSIYSIISIACADAVYNNAAEIKQLRQEVKVLKASYISKRTTLMHERKESKLLRKAEFLGFSPSINPPQIIYISHDH